MNHVNYYEDEDIHKERRHVPRSIRKDWDQEVDRRKVVKKGHCNGGNCLSIYTLYNAVDNRKDVVCAQQCKKGSLQLPKLPKLHCI